MNNDIRKGVILLLVIFAAAIFFNGGNWTPSCSCGVSP